jgi:cysteine desulfurase/selenocysteine lyase
MQIEAEVECSDCSLVAEVVGLDVEVPLLDGSRARYVNLDNAATTPCLSVVQAKVNEFLRWYSSIHRGT